MITHKHIIITKPNSKQKEVIIWSTKKICLCYSISKKKEDFSDILSSWWTYRIERDLLASYFIIFFCVWLKRTNNDYRELKYYFCALGKSKRQVVKKQESPFHFNFSLNNALFCTVNSSISFFIVRNKNRKAFFLFTIFFVSFILFFP